MFSEVRVESRPVPQVVVVGRFKDEDLASLLPKKAPWAGVAVEASQRMELGGGDLGKIAEAFPAPTADGPSRVVIVGLGKKGSFKAEQARTAIAAVARRLASVKAEHALLALGPALDAAEMNATAFGRCAGEAFGLLSWDNLAFKGSVGEKARKESPRPSISIDADRKASRTGLEYGLALAESVNMCRSLSETPPNIATPDYIAGLAQKMAKQCGLKFSVIKGKDLEKEQLVGHINVGKASENGPCMIRLEYTPEKVAKNKTKPAVLIGKTMTYDTGGLSLKVNNGMVGMKRDKDGGCAVLGAMHAIATIVKPNRPVVALLCSAENSISDEAYRPDDVITYRNGVTVEITNTDAEGRLVLADGFCWACDKEDPAYIVELSTLTGGVVTALGSTFCGMFCDDDTLRGRVEAAAAVSGERVWRLPMHQEYRDMMKSPVADILNSNPNRKAHAGQGAAFLSYFVKDGIPWCHLDIAGVHVSESDSGMFAKGSNGWGVRILTDLIGQE
ncbi:MAG: leucyl aminopeptidase family protein [Phycisphaerales bacterium]|jgi:leucyl aminopeptidase|nr:leucyl aminopeptidase family protein [Phycisphaerales bacterium]